MSEILKKLSEPIKIEEIDFRVQSINKGGYATILAYKDARVDMNRLDEVCNALWQDKYELIDGQLFCSIGIKIENEWIWRQDVGVESYSEKEKGRASDAFKRAGFRWGIGRELYGYPLIQVKLNSNEFTMDGDKAKATWNLKLKDWKWNAEFKDGKIVKLTANDEKGVLRFDSSKSTDIQPQPQEQNSTVNQNQKELPWLNVADNSKNFTPQWKNVVDAINDGKIKNISDVKKFYRVSKATEEKINEILNFQQA